MALPNDPLSWIQNGEPVTGTNDPAAPNGVANRPLNELLTNDRYLEFWLNKLIERFGEDKVEFREAEVTVPLNVSSNNAYADPIHFPLIANKNFWDSSPLKRFGDSKAVILVHFNSDGSGDIGEAWFYAVVDYSFIHRKVSLSGGDDFVSAFFTDVDVFYLHKNQDVVTTVGTPALVLASNGYGTPDWMGFGVKFFSRLISYNYGFRAYWGSGSTPNIPSSIKVKIKVFNFPNVPWIVSMFSDLAGYLVPDLSSPPSGWQYHDSYELSYMRKSKRYYVLNPQSSSDSPPVFLRYGNVAINGTFKSPDDGYVGMVSVSKFGASLESMLGRDTDYAKIATSVGGFELYSRFQTYSGDIESARITSFFGDVISLIVFNSAESSLEKRFNFTTSSFYANENPDLGLDSFPWKNIYYNGSLTNTSDARLKVEDSSVEVPGLSLISRIPVRAFRRKVTRFLEASEETATHVSVIKKDEEGREERVETIPISELSPDDKVVAFFKEVEDVSADLDFGVFAQDVESAVSSIAPNLIGTNALIKKNLQGYYSLDVNDLIAVMLKAIQELSDRVSALESSNSSSNN